MISRILTALLLCVALIPVDIAAGQALSLRGSPGTDKPYGRYEPTTRKRLALYGSRGETLNFLLKFQAPSCRRIRFSPLTKSNGTKLRARPELFHLSTIRTHSPSYDGAFVGEIVDPLMPLQRLRLCPGTQGTTWFFGEIFVPYHADPGLYRGSLRIGKRRSLPINLTVWKMSMPNQATFPAYSEFSNWKMLKGHFGTVGRPKMELFKKYTDSMQAHRIIPIKNYIDYPPIVEQRAGPFLDIYNYPSPETSYYSVVLETRPAWAYFDFPTIPYANAYSPISKRYFKAVQNTATALSHTQNAVIFLWDEPRPNDIAKLIEYASYVKSIAPSVKLSVTVPGLPELGKHIDIIVPSLEYFGKYHASFEDYRNLQKMGREVWAYVACGGHGCSGGKPDVGSPDFVIDRPAAFIKSLGWIAAKYDLRAFLYYAVNYGYGFYPARDPWKDSYNFGGNGDGTLFYPGRGAEHGLKEHMPITSIRLKLWRETSFDAEYLNWAKKLPQQPAWLKAALNNLVKSPQDWQRSYAPYRRVRKRLGAYLHTTPVK
ncbi:MAG: DUF4091 domain-containing protein [Deltaproteobacteria bacterium]|nr:DUF4091 domain-containing protein [Deltaproteobacteria bacterium]